MHETTSLHFDLSHLSQDQPFTLHAGTRRYVLTPHDRRSLAQARRGNAALARVADQRITHFAGPVRLPGNAPVLLRVTAPKLRQDDLLDRLVLTSLRLPRAHRIAALAQQPTRNQRQLPGRLTANAKLARYGLADDGTGLPPDEQLLIDVADFNTAEDAAASLVFHHCELMTLQPAQASNIVTNFIMWAAGLDALAHSILAETQAHDKDFRQPNWVTSKPGTDWSTGQSDPAHPVYTWSENTLANLRLPLRNALQLTKDEPKLQGQCWTVQPGVTRVPVAPAPAQADLAAQAPTFTCKDLTPQSGVTHTLDYDPGTRTATVKVKNYYLRWLSVSVDQYDLGGKQVGITKSLGIVSPVDTIMGIPQEPDDSPYRFVFDPAAHRATVSFGGLGQAPFSWTYDGDGIVATALFNLAIPALFVAAGVALDQGGSGWSDLEKSVAPVLLALVEASTEGPLASALVTQSADLPGVLEALANLDAALLTSIVASSDALKVYLGRLFAESALEQAEPFIGWTALAIGAAADLASIVETSVEVARSPATMSIDIERIMNVQVLVSPDISHGKGKIWPQDATRYTISITYDDGPVYAYDGSMSPTTEPVPIDQTFPGLPAGGTLTVLASFYSDTGWLAGQGVTSPIAAQPGDDGTLTVALPIKEFLVPLSATTHYTLKEKLVWASGSRIWAAPPAIAAPTATESDLDSTADGNHLSALGQLTVDRDSRLGYLWRASGQNVPRAGVDEKTYSGQEYTFQTLADQTQPQAGLKFSGVGYMSMPCLALPPPTMATSLADGFLLEPDDTHMLMHLRQISLTPGQPMVPNPGQSFGRFTYALDDLAIHPAGYAVALDKGNCKLEVVRLSEPVPDASAPAAQILSGKGSRDGLLQLPVAVACSLDKIAVLQSSDAYPQGSVRVFDVKGNPVSWFPKGPTEIPLRQEGATNVELLDLSLESKGYLYVLKCLKPASGTVLTSDYRLDIYNPDGTFLTQVVGLAAARLQVDLWRTVFTLNYEILLGSGRTEPSVSEWIPSTPGTSALPQGDS